MKFNCFKGKGYAYALATFFICFLFSTLAAQERNGVVHGVVQGRSGEPVAGVSVIIRNTRTNFTAGTSTDTSGSFDFNRVPTGGPYTFNFSLVGYESQTLSGYNLKSGTILTLAIKMKDSSASLDQVVVVGYGTQKRKDLTGAVGSVSSKDIKDIPVTRAEQALSGRVAGVQVKFSDGQPGAAPQVRVRGVGSISAGVDPLYVVDGFPTDNIQTINPNDIESIDILKDASATAIYGSRGSNGVVIINTRRGSNGKAKIGLDAYYGLQSITRRPDFLSATEQADYYYNSIRNRNMDLGNNISGDPATWGLRVPQTILDVRSGKNTTNVDALDSVLRTAPQKSVNLSVSGGNEGLRYAVSSEFFDQAGIIINNNFKRYSFRANMDAQLTRKLLLRVSINPSYIASNNVTAAGTGAGPSTSIIGSATSAQPYYPLHNVDGSYFIYSGIDASTNLYNPLALAQQNQDVAARTRLLGNLGLQYTLLDGLRLNILLGGTSNSTKGRTFLPSLPVFLNNAALGTDYATTQYNWLAEYTANYNKSFGKHSINVLAGYTVQAEVADTNQLSSTNYPNNIVPYLSATGGTITSGTAVRSEWALVSQLARVNYNFNSKYLITASIRRDGSSRFGAANKYGFFPSAAIAWRVSSEEFLKSVKQISDLRLRLSYGETGNNNIGNYASISTVNYVRYTGNGAAIGGYVPAAIPNPNLTWEKQRQINMGADLSLLNSRLNISVDHFISRNTDLLLNVNIPTASGFGTALQNIGEVKNTGWEFVLNTVNVNTKNFRWSTDFNLSAYRNKVTKLGPNGDDIIVTTNSVINITRIGQPIGMFYGYQVDGIFKNAAELAAGPIYNGGLTDASRVGDIRFKDVSGPGGKPDGKIDNNDLTIIGSPYPDFYYGMTNRLSYKSLSLSFNVAGSKGAEIFSNAFTIYKLNRSRSRTLSTERNFWKSEADPGDGQTPRPVDNTTGGIRLPSTRYIDDGSYFRVNNITLGYLLPDIVSKTLHITSFRVYGTANNSIIISNNKSFNPDVSNSGNALTPGLDLNNYPLPKSFVVGINVVF